MKNKQLTSASIQIIFIIINLSLIISFFNSPAYSETTGDEKAVLIAKIIDAYGGKEKLSKVVSISAEGRIKKNFQSDEGMYSRYMKRDRKLFVDIRYSSSSEKRTLNGKKGYRKI